eukprot:scaffold1484_cov241-Pinguiococcus_pyrenoidosus.AAC.34
MSSGAVVVPKTRRNVVTVGEIPTEIVVQGFEDTIFVVITQMKKLGSMVGCLRSRCRWTALVH